MAFSYLWHRTCSNIKQNKTFDTMGKITETIRKYEPYIILGLGLAIFSAIMWIGVDYIASLY